MSAPTRRVELHQLIFWFCPSCGDRHEVDYPLPARVECPWTGDEFRWTF